MQQAPTVSMQNYLKAIHGLDGANAMVSTAKLAQRLGVRAASVTGMLKRLAESGWIVYSSGQGARLTPLGTTEARRVIRRHRLMELFLTRVLGLDWSEVDAEAETLEHAISPRLEQAIADYLGEPVEDPHGHLIPTEAGSMVPRELRALSSFAPGDSAIIREVQDDKPERLRRWSELGLIPGAKVTVRKRQELDGTFEIQVNGRRTILTADGLAGVFAEPADGKSRKQRTPPSGHGGTSKRLVASRKKPS
jgi:DtxR family transcriptional regulator, Mn-dependent transcriptional regulator